MKNDKWNILEKIIKNSGSLLVAFSGGVDSALLAKIAYDILKDKALAVTVSTALHKKSEPTEAASLAAKIGIKHIVIKINSLKNRNLLLNDKDRCYHCKLSIFTELKKLAQKKGFINIAEASNASDLSDYRPGIKACRELKILQPFVDAGITKSEIRAKSKALGLISWNKPSTPCLITRIPFGESLTEKKLRRIENAEIYLFSFGFYNLRVRDHNNTARIEVDIAGFKKILDNREKIISKLKSLGFAYITLDIEGFRSGSLNNGIKKSEVI